MPDPSPEQRARERIDAQLRSYGWEVQARDRINLSAARGVAVCELSFATGEAPKALIAQFRNSYHPRIAVTVDMIATGTDIKPLEIVFFLRSVASKNFFEQHQAEITALQLLYSRLYQQRLTEPMLKELEKKLRDQHAAWTEDNLWNAFADLVALVRFALEQQPVLEPFADSVTTRFNEWLMDKAKAGVTFSPDQLAWLNLIRDQPEHRAGRLRLRAVFAARRIRESAPIVRRQIAPAAGGIKHHAGRMNFPYSNSGEFAIIEIRLRLDRKPASPPSSAAYPPRLWGKPSSNVAGFPFAPIPLHREQV